MKLLLMGFVLGALAMVFIAALSLTLLFSSIEDEYDD